MQSSCVITPSRSDSGPAPSTRSDRLTTGDPIPAFFAGGNLGVRDLGGFCCTKSHVRINSRRSKISMPIPTLTAPSPPPTLDSETCATESWIAIVKRPQRSSLGSGMTLVRSRIQPSSRHQSPWNLLHPKPASVRALALVLWVER